MSKGWVWAVCLLLAAFLTIAPADLFAKSDEHEEDEEVVGSIAIPSEEAMRAKMAKVTLVEAVGAALKKAPGKAISAELEDEDGFLAYVVEVVGDDNKVMEVTVDAGNKKILKSESEDEESEEDDVRYKGKHRGGGHNWGKHRGGEEEDD